MYKSLSAACTTSLLAVASTAYADMEGIHILSQEYHVSGSYYVLPPYGDPPFTDEYGATGNSPVNGAVEYDPYVWASSAAGLLEVSQSSSAWPISDPDMFPFSSSLAASTLVFRPTVDSLLIELGWSMERWTYGSAVLTDLTADNVLLDEQLWELGQPRLRTHSGRDA